MIDLRNSNEDLKIQCLFFASDGYVALIIIHFITLTEDFYRLADTTNTHGAQFSKEDLKAEVIIFTAASIDGVGAFISAFFDNLLSNPEAYARIVDEIQAAYRASRLSPGVVIVRRDDSAALFHGLHQRDVTPRLPSADHSPARGQPSGL